MIEPDAAELRVLGALIEKQRTTPDVYPLSLNALRLATNQSTGRDPVVSYDEEAVREAVARLVRRGWARLASGPGSRVTKYRHLLDEALALDGAELSLLAVLMLRGVQTPGELRTRSERLYEFATLEELEALLESLAARRLARRFERRPGQKEARWHLGAVFGAPMEGGERSAGVPGDDHPGAGAPAPTPDVQAAAAALGGGTPTFVAQTTGGALELRIAALEREVSELRELIAELREERR